MPAGIRRSGVRAFNPPSVRPYNLGGDLWVSFNQPTFAFTAEMQKGGEIAVVFPSFALANLTATNDTLAVRFPSFAVVLPVLSGAKVDLAVAFPVFAPVLHAQKATQLAVVFPLFQTSLIAAHIPTIALGVEFPVFVFGGVAQLSSEGLDQTVPCEVWVVNEETKAHSTYTNWRFNSYGEFNGIAIVAFPDGLYTLTGDEDGTTQIDAKVYWAPSDLGTNKQKTGWDAYVRVRGSGEPIRLVAVTDEVEKRIYTGTMVNFPKGIHPKRFQSTRALQGRMWQFGFENTQGGDFALEEIEIIPVVGSRRLK